MCLYVVVQPSSTRPDLESRDGMFVKQVVPLFNVGLVPISSGPPAPYEHVVNIYIAWCVLLKHYRLERPKRRRLTPGNMVLALTKAILRKLEVS
jgi:hypothetical protein